MINYVKITGVITIMGVAMKSNTTWQVAVFKDFDL